MPGYPWRMNLIQPSDGRGEQKPETDNKESAERNDSPAAADSPDNINSTQELTNPSGFFLLFFYLFITF